MYINREKLAQVLFSYFDFNAPSGTHTYNYVGEESMFNIGILKINDFKKIDEDFVYELADYIEKMM